MHVDFSSIIGDISEFLPDLPITDPTWIFFLVLAIILFAPMILERLHIPHIIGMILAGIIIGEHGFNILERDSSFELFGQVGLYYIMFLAGLEMDMDDFKKNRFKALVFGILTFAIPMALGTWSSMEILGFGLTTSVLLASMYASHTLIAYPIISRYGLSRLRSVNITIGGTALTVTLALLVLAAISGMYKGSTESMFWIRLSAGVIIVTCLIVIIFPIIARRFFKKYSDNIMQFVFVLTMVFLGGGLMELVGMEGILGAFLTGLVLNRLIPHVSPLMNRLEFVGNALFIPYFLIGVGMIIDVNSLFAGGAALTVAIVMTVVATLSKWLAAFLTQVLFRMKSNERSMIFGLSNAQAAATLAAVLIGHQIILENGEPLLNDDVLNGTIVMILFTCIISSVVTERSARKFALDEQVKYSGDEGKKREQIIIPISNPDTIEQLVNLAIILKNKETRIDRETPLIALNIVVDSNDENPAQKGKENLERAAQVAASADVPLEMVSRYDINVASGIIHAVKEFNATNIVIGLHSKANIIDSFFGNLATGLLKGTNKEVMIARFNTPVNTIRKIFVFVPPKAEYEVGFFPCIHRIMMLASQSSSNVILQGSQMTTEHLEKVRKEKKFAKMAQCVTSERWLDLDTITNRHSADHLYIIITSRRGAISYSPYFERIPALISKKLVDHNLIVVFPEQLVDPDSIISFTDPLGHNESQHYDNAGKWLTGKFKKS